MLTENMKHTYSVCPICLKQIPAVRKEREGEIVLTKSCLEHGSFSGVIWRNRVDFAAWRGEAGSGQREDVPDCASCEGLCGSHLRGTCCTLLEVTDRCNMNCAVCFADPAGKADPDLETVKGWIDGLTEPGKTLLQLSGGEPTVREDLPEIVAYAKQAGCKYVQLNSNGLRLAEDEALAKRLAAAGLSFVFMQFDGVDDRVYETLRRRPMLELKKKAIENCNKHGIGVTLVPVIVPGVNGDQIGEIIRFAVRCSPAVRGVHFQPISYFGRIPAIPADSGRFTLDELMDEVVKQSGGLVRKQSLAPSCCDHPMCGFHADFVVMPDQTLYALTGADSSRRETEAGQGCCFADPAEKNREFVARRWEIREKETKRESCCCGEPAAASSPAPHTAPEPDMTDMETFLNRVRSHGFTITSMAFQDAGNLDIERLRQCSLHVYKEGKHIPFCAYYLSSWEGIGQ